MRKNVFRLMLPVLAAVMMLLAPAAVEAAVRQTAATTDKVYFEWDAMTPPSSAVAWGYKVSFGSSSSQIKQSGYFDTNTRSTYVENLGANSEVYVKVELAYLDSSNVERTYTSYSTYCYTTPVAVTQFTGYDFRSSQKGLDVVWAPSVGMYRARYDYEIRDAADKLLMSGADLSTSELYLSSYKYYNKAAKIRVRPSVKNYYNGAVYYGAWSSYHNLVPQPVLKLKKNKYGVLKNHTLKVGWSKVKGASGYLIYVSTKEKSGYKKVATVKSSKTSYTIKKFKKKKIQFNKMYYVKVVTKTKKLGKSKKNYGMSTKMYYY